MKDYKCHNKFCILFDEKKEHNCFDFHCDCSSFIKEPIFTLSEIRAGLTDGTLLENPEKQLSLEKAKENPERLKEFNKVFIYTLQHRGYWRANGKGYTQYNYEAGVYTILEAYDRTKHCDSSKGIKFIEAKG